MCADQHFPLDCSFHPAKLLHGRRRCSWRCFARACLSTLIERTRGKAHHSSDTALVFLFFFFLLLAVPPKLHDNAGPVPACAPDVSGDLPAPAASPDDAGYDRFAIPSLADLGVEPPAKALKFRGGEREALSRFETVMVSADATYKPCSTLCLHVERTGGCTKALSTPSRAVMSLEVCTLFA